MPVFSQFTTYSSPVGPFGRNDGPA